MTKIWTLDQPVCWSHIMSEGCLSFPCLYSNYKEKWSDQWSFASVNSISSQNWLNLDLSIPPYFEAVFYFSTTLTIITNDPVLFNGISTLCTLTLLWVTVTVFDQQGIDRPKTTDLCMTQKTIYFSTMCLHSEEKNTDLEQSTYFFKSIIKN